MTNNTLPPDLAEHILQRVTSVHALSLFGDHKASADVADEVISELRRRTPDQLLDAIAVLAENDTLWLAQVAVWAADPQARENARTLVDATDDELHGSEAAL